MEGGRWEGALESHNSTGSPTLRELGPRLNHRHRDKASCSLGSGEGAGVEYPSPSLAVDTATRQDACLTCDIEMGIAGCFAQLVGDDTLIDTSVLRPHSWEHQAMYVPVWGGGTVTRD